MNRTNEAREWFLRIGPVGLNSWAMLVLLGALAAFLSGKWPLGLFILGFVALNNGGGYLLWRWRRKTKEGGDGL